jgi:hypothetical protein
MECLICDVDMPDEVLSAMAVPVAEWRLQPATKQPGPATAATGSRSQPARQDGREVLLAEMLPGRHGTYESLCIYLTRFTTALYIILMDSQWARLRSNMQPVPLLDKTCTYENMHRSYRLPLITGYLETDTRLSCQDWMMVTFSH